MSRLNVDAYMCLNMLTTKRVTHSVRESILAVIRAMRQQTEGDSCNDVVRVLGGHGRVAVTDTRTRQVNDHRISVHAEVIPQLDHQATEKRSCRTRQRALDIMCAAPELDTDT